MATKDNIVALKKIEEGTLKKIKAYVVEAKEAGLHNETYLLEILAEAKKRQLAAIDQQLVGGCGGCSGCGS